MKTTPFAATPAQKAAASFSNMIFFFFFFCSHSPVYFPTFTHSYLPTTLFLFVLQSVLRSTVLPHTLAIVVVVIHFSFVCVLGFAIGGDSLVCPDFAHFDLALFAHCRWGERRGGPLSLHSLFFFFLSNNEAENENININICVDDIVCVITLLLCIIIYYYLFIIIVIVKGAHHHTLLHYTCTHLYLHHLHHSACTLCHTYLTTACTSPHLPCHTHTHLLHTHYCTTTTYTCTLTCLPYHTCTFAFYSLPHALSTHLSPAHTYLLL